ncbi:hypothetical protein F4560_001045 [Saccharothrix ecbatanensis]|uniref:Uncharacterized protein n=1 Tax=Saccharothrix ecbatanensis TaxID=1105145 RepID=A0A7W9HFF7_9PSEU|nr:hypothetical protein [Saccharothrix ecbatanensis]MBB5801277.1 hypothetical protein [Saccharothrix ecbatanensis]
MTAHRHPLDELVRNRLGLTSSCDEPEFATILEQMVADEAPRLFAVVQEFGDRVDGRIAAWGMAFADHAEVVSVEHRRRMSLQAPENALRLFAVGGQVRVRLVWFTPGEAKSTGNGDGPHAVSEPEGLTGPWPHHRVGGRPS